MVQRVTVRVLDVDDDGVELVVEVHTSTTVVGCAECGVLATPKDRRWVTLRDAPSGDRACACGGGNQGSCRHFILRTCPARRSLGLLGGRSAS